MAKSDTTMLGRGAVSFVSVVINPALIMGMVGSLVWFLVDALYAGNYPDRLLWCLSFFVFGSVLIARISIEQSAQRALAYSAVLGGLTFLALLRFVEYPSVRAEGLGQLFSFTMMGTVWWLTNRLTWDCTHFEDDRKASGKGLLAAAGSITRRESAEQAGQPQAEDDDQPNGKKKKKKNPELIGWLERWDNYRAEQRKKPHTPGLWILYFTLAALPVFALGQSLIDSADTDRQRATLMEAAIFVACGIGLLASTTLMGLDEYLRQRGVNTPAGMVASWFGLAAIIGVVFLGLALVLPKPTANALLANAGQKSDKELSSSRFSPWRGGEAGKGDKSGSGRAESKADGKDSGQGKSDNKGGQGQSDSNQQGSSGNQKGEGQSQSKNGNADSKGSNQGSDKSQQQGDGGKQEAGKQQGQQGSEQNSQGQGEDSKGEQGESKSASQSDRADGTQDSSTQAAQKMTEIFSSIGQLFQWVIRFVIIAALIIGFIYFILKGLAPFTNWARSLLEKLRALFFWQKKPTKLSAVSEDSPQVEAEQLPGIDEYPNPFVTGMADQKSARELVRYTFWALEALAREAGVGRTLGETPEEFAGRLSETFPNLTKPAAQVALLLARVEFSTRPMPKNTAKILQAVWQQIDQAASRYLGA